MSFQIRPLPQAFLDRVRNEGIDDQGEPVQRLIAQGGEPCRDVLRRARPGEAIPLASPDTAFVQARFPTYGCFACRIERAS